MHWGLGPLALLQTRRDAGSSGGEKPATGLAAGRELPAKPAAKLAGRHAPRAAAYFAAPGVPYFLRNLSTRPAVSTIFCLPV